MTKQDIQLQIDKAQVAHLCLERAVEHLAGALKRDGYMNDEQIATVLSNTKEYWGAAMHWQPMSEDAVFEESYPQRDTGNEEEGVLRHSAEYLLWTNDRTPHLVSYDPDDDDFFDDCGVVIPRSMVSDYLKINQPQH